MKQTYKKIIVFSLLSFGAAVAMNSLDDIDDDAPASNSSKNIDSKYKKIVENQIRAGSANNDPYAVLGVSKKASNAEIDRAFRELSALYHTDKRVGGNRELIDKITDAKNCIYLEKDLQLGLAYGIQNMAVRSVAGLIRNDVRRLTDQLAVYLVVRFLRTNIARPIRRFFIHSDDELEKSQEELYLLEQERTYNNYVIQKMSAQGDLLETLKLELKTEKLNKQLREKEKTRLRKRIAERFSSLHMPPIQLQAASADNDNDQTTKQSHLQSNENVSVDNLK